MANETSRRRVATLACLFAAGCGRVFDWQQLTNGLFRVRHAQSDQRPP